MSAPIREPQLLALGRYLLSHEYRFTTVTPDTHALVNRRMGLSPQHSLRDIFGWNRLFEPSQLPPQLHDLMLAADACAEAADGLWQAKVRFASLDDLLFVHSAFPTDAGDSVFFGPDSYRFVRAILPDLPRDGRLVDVGCGSGVAGIVASKRFGPGLRVVLTDINERALSMARVNAALAGVDVEVTRSDVLVSVSGPVSAVISNPPYLSDPQRRAYRDGGSRHGAALSVRIARESLARFASTDDGGLLLLYSGAAIVDGHDWLLEELEPELTRHDARYDYRELDPDVFGSELASPAYADVERIAAVLLRARVTTKKLQAVTNDRPKPSSLTLG
jgi:SAM-dependent methyltransferase